MCMSGWVYCHRYILDLPVPRCELRAELWKKLLPQQVPVAGSIDFMELGKRYMMYN